MAMSRSFGGTSLTTRPPISMVPPEISSSPAIIRRAVDLPQPEGPTSTMNSWSWMSRLRFSMTMTGPKLFLTCLRVTSAMRCRSSRSCRTLAIGGLSGAARPAPPAGRQEDGKGQAVGGDDETRDLEREEPAAVHLDDRNDRQRHVEQ